MDILSYMLPDQVWQLSNHLAVAIGGQPIYTVVQGNQIWLMKSPKGFPWDMNTFDDKFVYQSITEVGWTDPKTFKIFASQSWPGANGGVVWAARKFDENEPCKPIVTGDSSYRLYADCSHFTAHDLGGPLATQIEGPFEMDLGGDLGKQFVLTQFYTWGAGLLNLEINRYVKGYGLVQWELWNLVNGQYQFQKFSAFNKFMTGPLPQPVFPCGVPVFAQK